MVFLLARAAARPFVRRLATPTIRRQSTAMVMDWTDDDDDNNGIQRMTVAQLKSLCRERGFKVSGRKAELQQRLREAMDDQELAPIVEEEPAVMRNEFCFDRANGYRLVSKAEMERQGRIRDAVLSPPIRTADETESLLQLLTDDLIKDLTDHRENLTEVVLDEGRRPFAWVAGQRHFLGAPEQSVSKQQLRDIFTGLHFGPDNRAGINGSLHRISAIRNRDGECVGLTLRVGRYVPGNAMMIADLLFGTDASILFVGPPGSGKTSIIRDVARLLAENHSVVIVDTSCEIGGAGNVPHECIGLSRRMQVKSVDVQAQVMVECVQNHTPAVMVIDEIGREAEVQAALTCKERGVRIIASAHGNLPGLVRNAQLCDLVGGVDVVTVGDITARKDAKKRQQRQGSKANDQTASKLRAERKGPPIFDVIIELKRGQLHEWQVVLHCASAVDSILSVGQYDVQIRNRDDSETSSIQLRHAWHDVNRDRIIEAASKSESLLTSIPNMDADPLPEEYAQEDRSDYMQVSQEDPLDKKSKTCPVCEKKFRKRLDMIRHALNKHSCYTRLPDDIKMSLKAHYAV